MQGDSEQFKIGGLYEFDPPLKAMARVDNEPQGIGLFCLGQLIAAENGILSFLSSSNQTFKAVIKKGGSAVYAIGHVR